MNKSKNIILILIILLLGIGTYFLTTTSTTEEAATDVMEEENAMEATDTMEKEAMVEEREVPEDAIKFTLTEESTAMYVAQKRFLQREDDEVIGTTDGVSGEGWITPDGTKMMLTADIDLSLLSTDSEKRDSDVQGFFDIPLATITFDETAVQNPIVLGEDFTSPILAVVSINGVEQAVEFDVQGNVTDTGFTAVGAAEILMSDFGINPPSLIDVFTVDDLVELRFNIAAVAN